MACPSRPAKATGVPKRAKPQATFAGAPPRRSRRVTSGRPKPINQGFTETDGPSAIRPHQVPKGGQRLESAATPQ